MENLITCQKIQKKNIYIYTMNIFEDIIKCNTIARKVMYITVLFDHLIIVHSFFPLQLPRHSPFISEIISQHTLLYLDSFTWDSALIWKMTPLQKPWFKPMFSG